MAARLERTDDIVDALYQRVQRETLPIMREHPEHAEWTTNLLWTGHSFERIADHALNIGKRAAFIVTGVIARQQAEAGATVPA
jgi:phosphate uptake regulator